jgi:two-component system, sporulation sensor kinase D
MKNHIRNLLLYIFMVVIPTIAISLYSAFFLLKEDELKRRAEAQWVASIHQESWDQFIGETMTSMEIISLAAVTSIDTPKKMESLLKRTHQKDSRYGGLYLLNKNGTVITGSNGFLENTNLGTNIYIQNVIKTKDTIISDNPEVMINKQKVIGLATPIIDENRKFIGILVAHLRVDYIQNVMEILTPDTKLIVVNANQEVILGMNIDSQPVTDSNNWVSWPIERLPWSIQTQIPERENTNIAIDFIRNLFVVMVTSHILFLLIKYVLLKRYTAKEKQQNEAQKLELVGTLAASTAHEIRNPLTGVKGLIQLLSEKYTEPEDQFYFQVIDTELQRINEIVSEFLILGKPTAHINEKVDIGKVIQDLQPLIISEANSHNISCTWQLPPNPIFVECSKDQMKQVLLNITKNAFESMGNGGELTVNLLTDTVSCKIEIVDTGKGISKEEIQKIFHPFYTSKDTGTGLGLVVCKRLLHSFGGTIQISSKESKGTKVEITLPLVNMDKLK